MHNVLRFPDTGVISLDRSGFDAACGRLMEIAQRNCTPDVLVGIRSGGFYVAEAMAKASVKPLPVLAITCKRPSTRLKEATTIVKQLLTKLPRPVVDWMRGVEHVILTARPKQPKPESRKFDEAEMARLEQWLAEAGDCPTILIVDDSVDTGATLALVRDVIRKRAPAGAIIRSAVITVTTDAPLIVPDYTLLHRKLCRFPWSLDAQPQTAR
jgi:hypoxanthine phosphoribosyltransferase